MWPLLIPGQRYIARRDVEPELGDIVVAIHPNDSASTIVKRVLAIYHLPSTIYELSGTVSWSSTFTVTRDHILGVLETRPFTIDGPSSAEAVQAD